MENPDSFKKKRVEALSKLYTLDNLTIETLVYDILPYLNGRDIAQLCSTSRLFSKLCSIKSMPQLELIWDVLNEADFGKKKFGKETYIKRIEGIKNQLILLTFEDQDEIKQWKKSNENITNRARVFELERKKEMNEEVDFNLYGSDFIPIEKGNRQFNFLLYGTKSLSFGLTKREDLFLLNEGSILFNDHLLNLDQNNINVNGTIFHFEKHSNWIQSFKKVSLNKKELREKIDSFVVNPGMRRQLFIEYKFVDKLRQTFKGDNIKSDISMNLTPHSRIEVFDDLILSKDSKSNMFILCHKETDIPFCSHKFEFEEIKNHLEDENLCLKNRCPKC